MSDFKVLWVVPEWFYYVREALNAPVTVPYWVIVVLYTIVLAFMVMVILLGHALIHKNQLLIGREDD